MKKLGSGFLFLYLKQMLNLYKLIQKVCSQSPTLKLIDCTIDPSTHQPSFIVQITGKNLFPKISSQDILQDPSLLPNFDKEDQKLIYSIIKNLHKVNATKYSAHIVSKTFDRLKKEFVFTLEEASAKNSIVRRNYTLNELAKAADCIAHLDNNDKALIEFEISKTASNSI